MNAAKSWFRRVIPDIAAFAIGLGTAYWFKWETTDLVWSLWLGSLVLGYLTILSAIGGLTYIGLLMIRRTERSSKDRILFTLAGVAGAFLLLAFFSFHFCGFHAGHSVFLRLFFPIEGMPIDGFGRAFVNPPLLWLLTFRHLMKPYGLFLIPAVIAERQHVFAPFIRALEVARSYLGPNMSAAHASADKSDVKWNPFRDIMAGPYINIVRMHLLIFFFAFCRALKVDNFVVYAVVYAVYFFPWQEIRELRAARSANSDDHWSDP